MKHGLHTGTWMPFDQLKRGFTLIELLVVIAIIAVLMAILMPSLRAARELARGAVCLSNVKQLATAWTVYADGHDSKMVHIWRDETTWKVSSGEMGPGHP